MSENQATKQELEQAWTWVNANFPFKGYIRPERKPSYVGLPRTASNYLKKGATILDFGAGPCDKTAMFSRVGFKVTAFDDFEDPWHKIENNREKILSFAEAAGITYYEPGPPGSPFPFANEKYDMLMLHHVLEHLHDSPKELMNLLLENVKEGGYVFITVPNAVNLRKRIYVMLGKTNYPPYDNFYWYPGNWRGHIREYVRNDLAFLAQYLNLKVLELGSYNHFLHAIPALARPIFRTGAIFVPGFRDSWLLVAQKPVGWQPRLSLQDDEVNRILQKSDYYDYSK